MHASGGSQKTASSLRHSIRSLLEVPDVYTGWIPKAVWRGIAAIRKQRIDCLFSSGPWWTNHLVALLLSKITGLPWIAHFRDSWAQGHWVKNVTPLSVRIEKALERAVVKRADAVICVTEMQTQMLCDANPDIAKDKFVTIPNGFDDAEWPAIAGKPPNNRPFVITYAGNFYHGRSPYPLFRALGALIENGHIPRDEIAIELLGMCDMAEGSRVMDVAAECGIASCVRMAGVVPKNEALDRMLRSNLLLLLVDEQNYSIPAKTYEYLRARRPILALTTGGAVVNLLEQTGGAWIVHPIDIEGIQAAVVQAVAGDARIPDENVVRSYDRRVLTGQIASVLNRVCRPSEALLTGELSNVRN